MSLGKRPRPLMKRTTSMTEFSSDLSIGESSDLYRHCSEQTVLTAATATTISPRNPRRSQADFVETAHFLRACSLCKRRLVPGRDIYMYRGDSAFCSLECRQQQMNQDESKEKCSLASKKEATPSGTAAAVAGAKVISAKGETVAAV
ncbi:hypothetical protein NMG60_11016847 [Bertholletia excelsa]